METNLLLLLFTDASLNWGWCLYEAGLFDRLDDEHRRRIICLHSRSANPPDPLKNLQSFDAEPSRLKTFLEQLFIGKELLGIATPLAAWLSRAPAELDLLAEGLSELIDKRPKEMEYFNDYLSITVQDPSLLGENFIPPDARVEAREETFAIFKKQGGTWSWKDIEMQARKNQDQRWLNELASAMYTACKGNIPAPIHAVFQSLRDAKMYGPILHRMDKMPDGSFVFNIILNEEVSWQLEEVPTPLCSLLTSLMMATRFKYELLEKYIDKVGNGYNATPFESLVKEISQVVGRIESEAESRGLLERHNLIDCFSDDNIRDEIRSMYDTWYIVRAKLMEGVDKNDRDAIHNCLQKLAEINRRFLEVASWRYYEIMTRA